MMVLSKPKPRRFVTGLSILLLSAVTQAHEFWLEPEDFTLIPGQSLRANIKVGEDLTGSSYSFYPARFERFDIIQGSNQSEIQSDEGASPAVNEKNTEDGLMILASASTPRSLRYGRMIPGKFKKFLKNEGLSWVMAAHKARGLPEAGFTEAYSRFAKSLIRVGSGAGTDKALGLELELVMLNNPYINSDDALKVQLLEKGKPLANTQLGVFFKATVPEAEGKVQHTLYRTDEQGIVSFPRPEQIGIVLLNAVHMIEPDAKTILATGAVWESLWASVTFAIE